MAAPTVTTAASPATHGLFMPAKTPISIKSNQWAIFKLAAGSAALPAGMFLEEGPGEAVTIAGIPLVAATTSNIKIEAEAMETGEKSNVVTVEIKAVAAEFQASTLSYFTAPASLTIYVQGNAGTLITDSGIKHAGAPRVTSTQGEIEALVNATVALERVN